MLPEMGSEGSCPPSAGRGKAKLHAGRGRRGASRRSAAGGGYVGESGGELEEKEPERELTVEAAPMLPVDSDRVWAFMVVRGARGAQRGERASCPWVSWVRLCRGWLTEPKAAKAG